MAALAARQHGVVAARQLRELGLDRAAVGRRVRARRLHRVGPGVLAVGHPRLTASARLLAAVLAYGGDAMVSHRSAAAHWALLPAARGPVDVIATASHERRGTRRHRVAVGSGDRMTRDGVPTTGVGRTLADLATVVAPAALARAVHEAQVQRLLDARQVALALERSARRRGAEPLRALLAEVDPAVRVRSELERRFLVLLAASPLPAPRVNELFEVDGTMLELDVAWPRRRLAVELDGRAFHSSPSAVRADRRRDERLVRAGWRVLRVGWREVVDAPEALLADVAALLGAPS